MKNTYRYYILAYEDARRKRPIKHAYGGPPSSPTALRHLGGLNFSPKSTRGWVYIHVEYRGDKE